MTAEVDHRARALSIAMVVVASAVALDPGGWYPFGPAKWHAVVLAIIAAAWSTLRQPAGVDSARLGRAVSPWIRRGWLALLAVLFVAAIVGREPYYAWIGTPERRLGWLTWIVFGVCCWLGCANADRRSVRLLSRAVSGVAVFVGVYCLVELVVGAPVPVDTVGQRIGGPYGSAAFLGAVLCLLLPVTIATAADRAERVSWRIVAGVGAALSLVALIGSGTRAAVVGLVVGLIAVAAATIRDRRTVRFSVVALVAIAALTLLIGLAGATVADGRLDTSVGRLGRITESSRAAEWGVGLRIVAAHPVLGVGPEGYRTALADGITANYERTYGRDVIPDRAHNGVIDVAAAGGVVAGGLYFALVAAVLVAAWRRMRLGTTFDRGLAVAVVAYAVQQVFLFPVSVIDPVFWIFAGIVLARSGRIGDDIDDAALDSGTDTDTDADTGSDAVVLANDDDDCEHDAAEAADRPRDLAVARRWAVRLGTGALTAVVVVSAVLALAADRLAAQAVRGDRVAPAHRATELRPDFVRYWLLNDRLWPMSVSGIRAGLDSVDDAARVSPLDPVVRRRRAERFLDLAIATGSEADRARAVDAWAELATDPNCYRCHLGFGYALAFDGDRPGAIAEFERAALLARPDDAEARQNLAALSPGTASDDLDSGVSGRSGEP